MNVSDGPGEPAARLHSRYQPQLEADRYIKALNPCRSIDYYILIEPGLGYLISSLHTHCPDSKVIVLHADASFRVTQSRYPEVPMWFPDSGGVQEFLEKTIPDAASIRLIEWRPSLRVYGDACLGLVRESTEFIRRSEASRRTGAAFGKRWVRNFFRNVTLLRQTLLYRPMDIPIVITGSGPSLESAIPKICAAREGVFVLAASSSLPALTACGIMPDMVISTDGGGWALLHLHACFQEGNFTTNQHKPTRTTGKYRSTGSWSSCGSWSNNLRISPKLAFALSAALPSQCSSMPLLPMNDGSLWQSMVLHSIGVPSVLIPQRGTVTASALELALALGTGSIFLAGMDLSVRDIRSHARPYGFDHLFFGAASRLRPVYSQYFIRSRDMKAGGSHDVYAAWFKNRIASLPQRVFSLGGNHAALEDNLPAISLKATAKNNQNYFKIMTLNDTPEQRRRQAEKTLIAALDNPQYADALIGELAPLLFPSSTDVQPKEIAEAIRSPHG